MKKIKLEKNPIKHEYKINNKSLVVTEKEKDLGIWITDTLSWSYHTRDRCAKANKMLGFLRRAATEITDIKIRRTLYLSIVRSTLGYATQVWSPQSIDLITRTERIQRRATKFILKLTRSKLSLHFPKFIFLAIFTSFCRFSAHFSQNIKKLLKNV